MLTNVNDWLLVSDGRPWFVNGLNLVLRPWASVFDPFSISIGKIDQWIQILRLPYEFWNKKSLGHPLNHVHDVISLTNIPYTDKKEGLCGFA